MRAFTLVELLVAMGILSLMVALLAEMLNYTGGALAAGGARAERRQNVRALADTMVRELQAALVPLDASDTGNLQFVANPGNIAAKFQNPDALFWQAPIATDRRLGDAAEIGYFLKWDGSRPGNPRPLFCRFFVNPTDPGYQIYTKPADWLNDALLDEVAPAIADSQNKASQKSYQGLFSENVIGFWVRCFEKATDGLGNAIPPVREYDSRKTGKLPRSVKIYLVVMDSSALPRLRQEPDYATAGTGDEPDLERFIASLPEAIRKNARAFTTEVRLQNAP